MKAYQFCLPVFILCWLGQMYLAAEPKPLGEVWLLPKAFKAAEKIEYLNESQGKEQVLHVLVNHGAKTASAKDMRSKVQEIAIYYANKNVMRYPVRNGIILLDVTDSNHDLTILITLDLKTFEEAILRGGSQYKGPSNFDKFMMKSK
ncbi:hypothetical protein SAMN02745181_0425 [Rubritalea squalenifaciens DSM 18772]|uniref:Uncharacterized protein n=1 Tax=Rubritalea squalenifaciens DSM 18772 TaxID=1123071 RepID=A0A1M6C9I1_9BACT|nr:hypothetical protein [Rubritalea squalenifaciens]SHI57669.1 hypothetical protein SAMN02745181_0425 [Rubritalea squalenifaciens DSM 18772]